ncbi:MAG TPA: 4'-phosphopantetheinyl transferase superfamily protein [Polyangia bacterium]
MSAEDAVAAPFARTLPFGRVVGVALPAATDAAGLEALAARLLPEEQAHARALAPARRATWMGGRAALRAALADLGLDAGPILATPRGAPALPAGVLGSIAHKPTLAVALAARGPAGPSAGVALGIDVELARAPRVDISARVLTPAERRRVDALDDDARARAVLVAFAAKEAIYKALDPWLRRAASFQEVELDGLNATFSPRAGEPSFDIEVRDEPLVGHVLMTARVLRRGA